jgi:hypothetical protein
MRRILLMLTVATLIAVMAVATSTLPALGQGAEVFGCLALGEEFKGAIVNTPSEHKTKAGTCVETGP